MTPQELQEKGPDTARLAKIWQLIWAQRCVRLLDDDPEGSKSAQAACDAASEWLRRELGLAR